MKIMLKRSQKETISSSSKSNGHKLKVQSKKNKILKSLKFEVGMLTIAVI